MNFFYILANQFVTIFLAANTLTTLTFDSEINNCDYGVSTTALSFKLRRARTTISLIPKSDGIDTNMTCYLKNGKMYVFNLKWTKDRSKAHKNIAIFEADSKRGGKKVYEDATVRIFDAGKNYYVENKLNQDIEVNETVIKKSGISSKWSPLFINKKEVNL